MIDKGKEADESQTWEKQADHIDNQELDAEEEAAKKFQNLTKKRRQHVNEFDELNYERDHNFFMKTFQDPMVTKEVRQFP